MVEGWELKKSRTCLCSMNGNTNNKASNKLSQGLLCVSNYIVADIIYF